MNPNQKYLFVGFLTIGIFIGIFLVKMIAGFLGIISVYDYPLIGSKITLSMVLGFICTLGGLIYAYRVPVVNKLSHEIVIELSKVTRPGQKELKLSTIVVLIMVLIVSIILGLFDSIWSWLSDLVY